MYPRIREDTSTYKLIEIFTCDVSIVGVPLHTLFVILLSLELQYNRDALISNHMIQQDHQPIYTLDLLNMLNLGLIQKL